MTSDNPNDNHPDVRWIASRVETLLTECLAPLPDQRLRSIREAIEQICADTSLLTPRARLARAVQVIEDLGFGRPAQTIPDYDEALVDEGLPYSEAAGKPYLDMPSPDIEFDGLITENAMAQRLDITAAALQQRLTDGVLIGWRNAAGQLVFPAGQLDALSRPAQGLGRVLAHFCDPQVTWLWLSRPTELLHNKTPIDLLKSDDDEHRSAERIERVVQAAKGQALGAFR